MIPSCSCSFRVWRQFWADTLEIILVPRNYLSRDFWTDTPIEKLRDLKIWESSWKVLEVIWVSVCRMWGQQVRMAKPSFWQYSTDTWAWLRSCNRYSTHWAISTGRLGLLGRTAICLLLFIDSGCFKHSFLKPVDKD